MAKNSKCTTILLIFAFGITSLMKGMASEDLQVLVNDSAVISCFSKEVKIVQWHHTPPGKSSSAYVYAGGKFYFPYNTSRFSTYSDSTTNFYTFVITNVTPEDAGLYECKDDVLSGVFGSTQLIVLNSSPVCKSNMHSDGFIGPNKCDLQKENMTFSCAVSFAGKISPGLMWRSSNDSQSLINSVCIPQPNHINCSFTLRADPKNDGTVFICETKASIGARFNCSTEVIKIQYFSADNENSTRKVYDNVSCNVTSNLETRYNWKIEQNGQYVFLSSNRAIVMQKPGIYLCDVEYNIRNNTCSFLTSVVNASEAMDNSVSQKEQSKVLTIALSIVFAIVLLAVIVAFVIYVKCIKGKVARKKGTTKSDGPDTKELVPLNDFRRERLNRIRPRLAEVCTILQIKTELIEKLKVFQVINEGFDDADAGGDVNTRFENLLNAVSERINKGFDPLKKALAGINPTLAEYIEKGEIVAVDITTKMPDFDGPLSEAFSDAVINQSELFRELTKYTILMVVAKPSNSIEVLIYCRESKDMKKFISIFNSGELERLLSDALDKLLSNIQSSNVGSLEAKVFIEEKEVTIIGHFVHQNDWLQDKSKIRKLPSAPMPSVDAEIDLSSEREGKAIANHDFLFSIETKASKESKCPIYGLAILGNELFTISRRCAEFEVYDYTESRVERFKRRLQVEGLKDPRNIVACGANECLYIENLKEENTLNEIIIVDKEDGSVLDRWEIGEALGRISIAKESNVLVTVRNKSSLWEYTPEKGKDRRKIIYIKDPRKIEIDKGENIKNLRHALLMDTGHYVLCHGDDKDEVKRVCIVDKEGKVLAKFGDETADPEQKLTNPLYLAVHPSGSILVADDKRIVMLDRQLELERVLLNDEINMHSTFRVCLDIDRDLLLVADNEMGGGLKRAKGRVLVYKIPSQEPSNEFTSEPNGRWLSFV